MRRHKASPASSAVSPSTHKESSEPARPKHAHASGTPLLSRTQKTASAAKGSAQSPARPKHAHASGTPSLSRTQKTASAAKGSAQPPIRPEHMPGGETYRLSRTQKKAGGAENSPQAPAHIKHTSPGRAHSPAKPLLSRAPSKRTDVQASRRLSRSASYKLSRPHPHNAKGPSPLRSGAVYTPQKSSTLRSGAVYLANKKNDKHTNARESMRSYRFRPSGPTIRRYPALLSMAVCCAVFVFCAAKLLSYGIDYLNAQRASDELRQLYYEAEETKPLATATLPAPTVTPTSTAQIATFIPLAAQAATTAPLAAQTATAVPLTAVTFSPVFTAEASSELKAVYYPSNPYATVSSQFEKIRRQNKDIIGWLTIEDVVDEPVVQRDNEYYLNRDYRGYHNVNGAIFLDELCDLSTRPYTLMLYGHNMKTGAMFGKLRNYERLSYYRNNPFITFDIAYEDGRYVIFAVATISTVPDDSHYINFSLFNTTSASLREQGIKELLSCSLYRTTLEIAPQDQLLLLITCVDDDDERRVVAARRIREDEEEDTLAAAVQKTTAR